MHSPMINLDVMQTLEEERVDPIRVMARLARDGETEELRLSAAKELAQYIHPKKKALDLRAQGKLQVTYNIVNFSDVMPDEAATLEAQTKALLDSRPRTRHEIKMLSKMVQPQSAAIIEAMRSDVERLVVDEEGRQVE